MKNQTILKRLWVILLTLFWVVFLACPSAYVKADMFAYNSFYDAEEWEEILDLVSKRSGIIGLSDILGTSGDDLKKISYAYKLHFLQNGDIRPLVNPTEKLEESISQDYRWILVTDSNAQITVGKENGAWQVLMFGGVPTGNDYSNRIRIDMLQNAISSINVKAITAFTVPVMRNAVFVYVQAAEGDYLVPFSVRPDFTSLKNGKLYTREQIAQIVSREYSDVLKTIDENTNGDAPRQPEQFLYGGTPRANDLSAQKTSLSPVGIIATSMGCVFLFVIIFLVVVSVKNRKASSKR